MSRLHHNGGTPSQRMLRVAELVRHAVSELLSRGAVADPVLDGHVVTVSDVRMSPDLKLATVYAMPLGGRDMADVLAALERHRKQIRTEVAHRLNLKFAPDLRFKADQSFEQGAKIDAILGSPKVQRDIKPRDEEA